MFTRLAVSALTVMSGRLWRRPGSSKRKSAKRSGAKSGTPPAAAPASATDAPKSSVPGVVAGGLHPGSVPGPQPSPPPPPIDHFQFMKPRPAPPWPARIAGRSLPVLATVGAVMTALLAAGAILGELPFIGPVDSPNPAWAAALITIALWAAFLLWKVPQWQAAAWERSGNTNPRELFQIENESRATLGQILSGVAVLTGLIFAWQQLGQTSDNLRVSQEGQITDRFTRAVEQLGSDDLTVRLGGVYALERIAHDSPRDYSSVMEILASFIRQASPPTDGTTATPLAEVAPVPLDVDAAFKVIGRRSEEQIATEEGCLDLSDVSAVGLDFAGYDFRNVCWDRSDLRGAILIGANLEGGSFFRAILDGADLSGVSAPQVNFQQARLIGANLRRADLWGANFFEADLRSAVLDETNMSSTNLVGANLTGAFLVGTDLSGADVLRAVFDNATISGAKLAGAVHMTAEQIDPAFIDRATTLPENVEIQPDV